MMMMMRQVRKCLSRQSAYWTIYNLNVTLTFDLLTLKANQLTCVLNCTKRSVRYYAHKPLVVWLHGWLASTKLIYVGSG